MLRAPETAAPAQRTAWVAAAAAVAFLIVLIVRFPARWAGGFLPHGTACTQLGGTLWSGTCAGLLAEGTPLGDLTWSAHPLRLLTGKLSLTVSLALPGGTAHSLLTLSPSGAIEAQDVRATLPLNHALLAQLPPNVEGLLQVALASLDWNGKRLTSVRGDVEVHGLLVQGEPLGDYRVSFPAGSGAPIGARAPVSSGGSDDEPTGRLQDLGGPLAVQGTLRLTREPGFVLDTLVAPRASAPPNIVQDLRFLGSPDAQGRRPFSLAGTF